MESEKIHFQEASKLSEFLKQCRADLANVDQHSSVCVVLGNEACDLDSVVSALLYAKYSSEMNKFGDVHLPLLNINKIDYDLKTEVNYFFNRFNIRPQHLIFRDEVPLDALKAQGKLRLVLVDHNVLPRQDATLDEAVVAVIDHHKRERVDSENVVAIIEPVGSCCTLIGSLFMENAPALLDDVSATLLYGTILVDVANFSVSAKRATKKDHYVFDRLAKYLPSLSKDLIYKELQEAKEDVTRLTLEQTFRKDMKVIHCSNITLAICGFPFLTSTVFEKHSDIRNRLEAFASSFSYHGIVLMGIQIDHHDDNIKRDLAVFSQHNWLKTRVCEELQSSNALLDLVVTREYANCVCFNQLNVVATRKAILPMLKNLLFKLEVPGSLSITEEHAERSPNPPHSGIDTPVNSCADDSEACKNPNSSSARASSFPAKDVADRLKLEYPKRSVYEDDEVEYDNGQPATPKNSLAESHFDARYKSYSLNRTDTDTICSKLRQEDFFPEEQ